MATLRTTVNLNARGLAAFELTPNSPRQRDQVDTYQVRLWIHDQLVYDETHSVRDWQMRHYHVEQIARGFRCARELLGKQVNCVSDNSADDDAESASLSLVHAEFDADWLQVYLAAASTPRIGDQVHVLLYLEKARHVVGEYRRPGKWGEYQETIAATLICTPDDAIAFGQQLQREIDQAERERVSLGIPEYDDPTYGDSSDPE